VVLCRRPLILLIDAAGLTLVVGLLVVAAVWLAPPLFGDGPRAPRAYDALAAAHAQHRQLVVEVERQSRAVAAFDEGLEQLRRTAVLGVSDLVARLAELAAATDVELQSVQPTLVDRPGLKAWDVQVRARGHFADCQRLLRRVEELSRFVQVRTLSLTGPAASGDSPCELVALVRLNSLPAGLAPGAQP
jgi:Tfp pilus assembly protein PilO